ncbi:MAG: glycosyltransferase [Acidobacteria bacterium]|nr:glycosyltransferase [Acidobacteriota bacterium]
MNILVNAMPKAELPKVSVCMIAYNQEKFIGQAIESILRQKTDFRFEIVIGDDDSTDGTGAICNDYAGRFPETIKYIRREPNVGMMANFVATLMACDGDYIALCEGDDYWTDERKLQIQADYLDANPDTALCCHNHFVLSNGRLCVANRETGEDLRTVTTEDYMLKPFFHTSSYFFRKAAQPQPYPDWFLDVLAGDHFLVVLLSQHGEIAYLNRLMSVFRNHGNSVSFSRNPLDIKNNFIRSLRVFDDFSNAKFQATIEFVIRKWELIYFVYEPVGYLDRVYFLLSNFGFYLSNFRQVGGIKLSMKYVLPQSLIVKIQRLLSRSRKKTNAIYE